jgi:hypothetical protein
MIFLIGSLWEFAEKAHFPCFQNGVTTLNVKNRTLRNLKHSFGAVKGRRRLNEPSRRRPEACQVQSPVKFTRSQARGARLQITMLASAIIPHEMCEYAIVDATNADVAISSILLQARLLREMPPSFVG